MRWTSTERYSALTLTTKGLRLVFRGTNLFSLGKVSRGGSLFEFRVNHFNNRLSEIKIRINGSIFYSYGPDLITETSIDEDPVEFIITINTTEGPFAFRLFSGKTVQYHQGKSGLKDFLEAWVPVCDGEYPVWLKKITILGFKEDYEYFKNKTCRILGNRYQRMYEKWLCNNMFRNGEEPDVLA